MTYRERVRLELLTRCIHLDTKSAAFPLPDEYTHENPHDTAVWWCNRTCEAFGPDGSTAGPDLCSGGVRKCYAAPQQPAGAPPEPGAPAG